MAIRMYELDYDTSTEMATQVHKYNPDSSFAGEPGALYPLALGEDWHSLDAGLRCFHGVTTARYAAGAFNIQHGSNWLARLLARILRLPAAGVGVPIQVAVHCEPRPKLPHGLVEIWDRNFGSRRLISKQWIDSAGLLVERFGLMELSFMLRAENGGLCFDGTRASIAAGWLRVRMPRWLMPRIEARVACVASPGSGFAVSVRLFVPVLGLLLAYEGCVIPGSAKP
jgi:Domain of unknown function (DUF4166)